MKFEMKKPIFECPYCHEKIEGDYAAYQEHVQVCYEKDMARQKLKNEKENHYRSGGSSPHCGHCSQILRQGGDSGV